MTHASLLLFAPSETLRDADSQFVALLLESLNHGICVRHCDYADAHVIVDYLGQMPYDELRDTMAVVVLPDRDPFIGTSGFHDSRSNIMPRLVLTFPEVYFVFVSTSQWSHCARENVLLRKAEDILSKPGLASTIVRQIARYHFIESTKLSHLCYCLQRFLDGFRPIFDPTGLRALLKMVLLDAAVTGQRRPRLYATSIIARLQCHAACADEELPFATFNGLATYLAGYSTWLISTEAEFCRILPIQPKHVKSGTSLRLHISIPLSVFLTDWDLAFPDRGQLLAGGHPAEMVDYSAVDVNNAIVGIITSFPVRTDIKTNKGEAFLDFKPLRGLAALCGRICATPNSVALKGSDPGAPAQSHSALAPHLHIAELLMQRMRRMSATESSSSLDLVQCSVLAHEGRELLGGMSITMSLRFLASEHESELLLESTFPGVSEGLAVRNRISRIYEQAADILRGHRGASLLPHSRLESSLVSFMCRECSAFSAIVERTGHSILIADAHHALAHYQRKFKRHESVVGRLARSVIDRAAPSGLPDGERGGSFQSRVGRFAQLSVAWASSALALTANAILDFLPWYFDKVTRTGTSVRRLVCVSLMWVTLFASAFAVTLWMSNSTRSWASIAFGSYWHSLSTFVELQPGDPAIHDELSGGSVRPEVISFASDCITDRNMFIRTLGHLIRSFPSYHFWLMAEFLVSFAHLGLLIAILYQLVNRRTS